MIQAEDEPAKSRIIFAEDGMEKILSIDKTLKKYGNLSAYELVNLTHRQDSPWSKTSKSPFKLYSSMKLDIIREYHKFEEII